MKARKYLELGEAADYLRVSETTFKKHVRPNVPCSYIGTKPVFHATDLDAYMTDHRHFANDRPKRIKGSAHNLVRLNPKAANISEALG
jgi:hypothetical protein